MKRLLAAALLVALSATTSMAAFELSDPNYTGPIKFKYSNYENQVFQQGDTLNGIINVTGIYALDASNTALWTPSATSGELTGVFSGYTVQSVTPLTGGTFQIDFISGGLNIYYDDVPNFNAIYPGTGVTDGSPFMTLQGVGGIVVTDPNITLRSVVDALTTIGAGHGSGYLQVTGGPYAYLLGGIGGIASMESDFSSAGATRPGFGWPVVSEDPVVGNVVPEPSTVLLLGGGLLGLGLLRKRARK